MNAIAQRAKTSLLERQKALKHAYDTATDSRRELDETADSNWRDRATDQQPGQVLDRLSADERRALVDIEHALDRIAKGTWGTCERCNEAIGAGRLRALPEARLCIQCSATAEHTA